MTTNRKSATESNAEPEDQSLPLKRVVVGLDNQIDQIRSEIAKKKEEVESLTALLNQNIGKRLVYLDSLKQHELKNPNASDDKDKRTATQKRPSRTSAKS